MLFPQFYGNRHKMAVIGRENELEQHNRLALRMAREVADETGTLMCGDICNTFIYTPGDEEASRKAMEMFKVRNVMLEGAVVPARAMADPDRRGGGGGGGQQARTRASNMIDCVFVSHFVSEC